MYTYYLATELLEAKKIWMGKQQWIVYFCFYSLFYCCLIIVHPVHPLPALLGQINKISELCLLNIDFSCLGSLRQGDNKTELKNEAIILTIFVVLFNRCSKLETLAWMWKYWGQHKVEGTIKEFWSLGSTFCNKIEHRKYTSKLSPFGFLSGARQVSSPIQGWQKV